MRKVKTTSSNKWSLLDELHSELGIGSGVDHPGRTRYKSRFITLGDFSRGLNVSVPEATLIAADLGLPMDFSRDGSEELVDIAPYVRLVRLIAGIKKFGPEQRFERAKAAREQRERIISCISDAGGEYVYSTFDRGALMVFSMPDESRVGVLTYVSTVQSPGSQVTFNVGHLDDENVDWVVLHATRLGRTFAKTRDELHSMSADGKSIGLTFRAGTPADDELERRLPEIVTGQLRKRLPLPVSEARSRKKKK